MRISFIYRFNIDEIVYPSIDDLILNKDDFNIISGHRIRNEFLTSRTPIAKQINEFIDKGEIIPKELWIPFWTSLLIENKENIYTSLIGSLEQFIAFEKFAKESNWVVNKILYLKVFDIEKLTSLAVAKYGKIYYNNTEILTRQIHEYDIQKSAICDYSKTTYKTAIGDFFSRDILI